MSAERPIPLVCILGSTATGKTRLAALVASMTAGAIVSADSRQVYRRMDLGTGKDREDYQLGDTTIPTHLIDIVDPGYEYNLFEFKCDSVAAIREIHSGGGLPILCGGTGLYLSAVLQDYQLLAAPPDPQRHAELEALPTATLIAQLEAHGPLHNHTDLKDRKRLIRALEIAAADPSQRAPALALDAHVFGLRWERAALRRRITQRLTQRLESGLIDEVRGLLASGLPPEQLIFYGLEYRFVTEHLRGETSFEQMFDQLNAAIHQFAKRQDTWFRRMQRQGTTIHWLDGEAPVESNAQQIVSSARRN